HPALTGRVPGCGPNAPGPPTRGPRETRGFRGGEPRSTRIRAIRTRGAQTWGPHEIADFVGWETWGPHEACFVGWIGVRDPATLLQHPPERALLISPGLSWLSSYVVPQRNLILVVDDDPKIVALVRAYLTRAGFDVITAGDGGEALRLVRERRPR